MKKKMATSEFVPMSWNGEPITTDKLNQMCNNTQYLFDRSPRVRYSNSGVTRDNGVKIISGKSAYSPDNTRNYTYVNVYFGSFFSAGCNPAVTASLEAAGWQGQRNHVVLGGLGAGDYGVMGGQIDQTGFVAVISTEAYNTLIVGGWIHWTAVGY